MLRYFALLLVPFLCTCGPAQNNREVGESNGQVAGTTRPNILFIMSDDHAQRAISAYTDELVATPGLDRIANEGMLFRNSFVTNSICAPSRAAILTGKYSHLNGKIDNLSPFNPNQWTFTEELHKAGYRTSLIGKHHLKAMPKGIDEFRGLIGQGSYYAPKFVHNGDTLEAEPGYTSTIITDYVLEELKRNAAGDQPFCMLYWHKAPHRNWMPDTSDLPGLLDRRFPEPASLRDEYQGRRAAEHADMISMARPFLADEDFVIKARQGRADEINTCIGCNQACLDHVFEKKNASCLVNPRACHETELNYQPAQQNKKIAVVGAGPAGLARSTAAAQRGLEVLLYDCSHEIGGQFNLAKRIPGKEEYYETLRYFNKQIELTGVHLHLNHRVDADFLAAGGFDESVLATGVSPLELKIEFKPWSRRSSLSQVEKVSSSYSPGISTSTKSVSRSHRRADFPGQRPATQRAPSIAPSPAAPLFAEFFKLPDSENEYNASSSGSSTRRAH